MTKANELVDAKINFISFVKKGANGDPLRILKSEDGQGIDLASLNKADDEPVNVPVKLPKADAPSKAVPEIAEEVIQKLSLMGIARAARSVSRNFRQGARAGYRYARDPGGNRGRNLQTAVGHLLRSRAGGVGMIGGTYAGLGVNVAVNRVARARAAGQRIGAGLRAGYAAGRLGTNQTARSASALRAAYELGARRSITTGFRAGQAANQAGRLARAGRVWVRDAGTRGGGYWRRVVSAVRAVSSGIASRARVAGHIASEQARVGYYVGRAGHIGAALRLSQPAYRAGIIGGYAARGAVGAANAGRRLGAAGRSYVNAARAARAARTGRVWVSSNVAGGGYWPRA